MASYGGTAAYARSVPRMEFPRPADEASPASQTTRRIALPGGPHRARDLPT